MKDTYALVTGASSGLGFEFAKQLSERGYKLILVARRRDKLETVQKAIKTDSIIIAADLSQRDECVRVVTETIGLSIDVFINNAGFGDCGRFYETDANKDLSMIDVNVTAMHLLMKMMLQRMKSSKVTGGYILNVASSAGLFPAGRDGIRRHGRGILAASVIIRNRRAMRRPPVFLRKPPLHACKIGL